jgi:hypothetical protein
MQEQMEHMNTYKDGLNKPVDDEEEVESEEDEKSLCQSPAAVIDSSSSVM